MLLRREKISLRQDKTNGTTEEVIEMKNSDWVDLLGRVYLDALFHT